MNGPKSDTEKLAGLVLKSIRWLLILVAAAAIGLTVVVMAAKRADGGYPRDCTPGIADATWVAYEPAGANTEVLIRAYCGGGVADWYVGFFTGHDQPDLWEWYAIQNAASELLRDR